uniref:AlNc14C417G11494 protein n=1 Tax=Albugo laibachii Nc14 TaxID=890382 RepID=F0WZ88_9STRA|nr:AlNc14C417G11494 [Albugo laibachii Nc14]|eukprot:CCA26805.1 AlNc14C417G11494 [Albugo laibachii Nc14]
MFGLKKQLFEVEVHIADISHFRKRDTYWMMRHKNVSPMCTSLIVCTHAATFNCKKLCPLHVDNQSDIRFQEYPIKNINRLIEEYILLANHLIACHLTQCTE